MLFCTILLKESDVGDVRNVEDVEDINTCNARFMAELNLYPQYI